MSLMLQAKFRILALATLGVLFAGCSTTATLPPTTVAQSPATTSDRGELGARAGGGSGSLLLTVSVSQPTISVARGATAVVPCVFTIAANDPTDPNYIISFWGTNTVQNGPASFPMQNAPRTSNVSWSIDESGAYRALPNAGNPGWVLWSSSPSTAQSHCLDVEITVPATTPTGAYPLSLDVHLGTRAQFSILQDRQMQRAITLIEVTP